MHKHPLSKYKLIRNSSIFEYMLNVTHAHTHIIFTLSTRISLPFIFSLDNFRSYSGRLKKITWCAEDAPWFLQRWACLCRCVGVIDLLALTVFLILGHSRYVYLSRSFIHSFIYLFIYLFQSPRLFFPSFFFPFLLSFFYISTFFVFYFQRFPRRRAPARSPVMIGPELSKERPLANNRRSVRRVRPNEAGTTCGRERKK